MVGACQAVAAACQEAAACLEGTCQAASADSLEVGLHTAQEEKAFLQDHDGNTSQQLRSDDQHITLNDTALFVTSCQRDHVMKPSHATTTTQSHTPVGSRVELSAPA